MIKKFLISIISGGILGVLIFFVFNDIIFSFLAFLIGVGISTANLIALN